MKITPINSQWFTPRVNNKSDYVNNPSGRLCRESGSDVFVKSSAPAVSMPKPVVFMGHNVYLVDGGNHAQDMLHFAKAINQGNRFSVQKFETQDPLYSTFNKPWRNVEAELQKIYYSGILTKDDYVAVPVYVNVPLQNIEAQYKKVMGKSIDLKPYNILTHKQELLEFLKRLAREPKKYEQYLRYMDPQDRGLEYAAGIIDMINKLDCKKVYVPASHPHEASLRWMAAQRGYVPELTNYLATGYDKDGVINGMLDEIKNNGWYDFNLLTLSNADIVNYKKSDGVSDHIFAAYDTAVNDGARGVYNLSPVRSREGEVLGYSFTDNITNHYPVDEFPYNEELRDISKFVGRSVYEVVADKNEIASFKEALGENRDMLQFADKLYPVWEIFTPEEISRQKIYEKGDFVDYKLENFFRRNGDFNIIYPAGDCENSGRPSVKSMGGSSYSMFAAIKRDIDNQVFYERVKEDGINLEYAISEYIKDTARALGEGKLDLADEIASDVLRYIDMVGLRPDNEEFLIAYKNLADIKYSKRELDSANGLYNFYLNKICKKLENSTPDYFIEHVKEREHIASIFIRLADIARMRGELDSEQACRIAAKSIVPSSNLGYNIINRRAKGDINIGDLINEN